MKRLVYPMIIIMLISASLFAQGSVSVFPGNDNAKIFIDDQQVSTGILRDYRLDSGTHLIEVRVGSDRIYYKGHQIVDGDNILINADDMDSLKAPEVSRSKREAKAWRKIKGSVGLGLHLGSPASGLGLKWWVTDKLGFQVTGWASTMESVGNIASIGGRLLVHLTDKLIGDDSLQQTYLAVGAGRYEVDGSVTHTSQEACFGFENPYSAGGYSYWEVGYEKRDHRDLIDYSGVKLSLGLMFYF